MTKAIAVQCKATPKQTGLAVQAQKPSPVAKSVATTEEAPARSK
jgi:hypothetical protein